MSKWLYSIAFASFLGFVSCYAQETTPWELSKTLDIEAQQCHLDQLNRMYLVNNSELLMLNERFEQVAIYSNKLIGEHIQLDVTNPLKILVYSPDQMQLLFLDSRLAELKEPINLLEKGFEQVSLAATSHSNGFWLYDQINFSLIRYNQNADEERRSFNLGQMLRLQINPTDLIELNNKVYLVDPNHGLLVFDVYANFINRYPIEGIETLIVNDERIFFKKEGKLYALHLIDLHEEEVMDSFEKIEGFDVNRTRIVAAEKNRLLIFTTVK